MPHYVDREQLALMVVASQLAGTPTPELIEVVRHIARGLMKRMRYRLELEDAQQAAVVSLFNALPYLDASRPCFNYLTSVTHNRLKELWNEEQRQRDIAEHLAREQGWRPPQSMPEA